MRFLLYSHDGLGLGHTRRHLAIARALADLASNASILVATGADEVSRLGLPARVEILKLPSLRKVANGEYASRRLRIPVPQIRQLRSSLLRAAVSSFRPQVVLVDKHPFGAGGEFYDSLETVRSYGGSCVLGFRDILDERTTVLGEWAQHNLHNRIAEFYDEVLVYGERAVFDPVTEYDFSDTLAQRTSFCGYVVNHEESDPTGEPLPIALEARQQQRPVVIATAGGGEDGYLLSQTFIHAAAGARWQGIVVSGPMTPENEQERLRESEVHAGVAFQTFIP